MITRTTESGPYLLGLPEPEPEPADGCDDCGELSRARSTARRSGDLSKVSDLNVAMRAHQGGGCS